MTGPLNDWLDAALRDLAPAAQQRVTAEYREHVQDAMTGGLTEPEAVATLGDPAQVNRALRRTYATTAELAADQGLGVWWFMLALTASYGLIALHLFGLSEPLRALGPAVALLLAVPSWFFLRNEPRAVRQFMLATTGQWLAHFSLWLTWMVQLCVGEPLSFQSFLWLLPVLWLVWMLQAGQKVQRMHRTLHLEGQA